MKIDNQLYFDENKLDQIITLSKNSIASGNDAHELALQKRIELLFKLESDQKLFKEKLKETLNNSSNDVIKNQVELIQSLDGFSETALNIVAETGDINRFHSASALVAFVGIDPRTEESGQMKKGWFINRKGNRYLRKAVYIAATVAILNNEYFKNYYMKLRTQGKSHTVAVLAVAGKLLRIIYSLVKSGKKYDPNYHYKLQNQELRVHGNYTAKKIKKRNSNPNKQQPLLST